MIWYLIWLLGFWPCQTLPGLPGPALKSPLKLRYSATFCSAHWKSKCHRWHWGPPLTRAVANLTQATATVNPDGLDGWNTVSLGDRVQGGNLRPLFSNKVFQISLFFLITETVMDRLSFIDKMSVSPHPHLSRVSVHAWICVSMLLETGSLSGLGLSQCGRLAGQWIWRICLTLLPQGWYCKHVPQAQL